jgi:hypothetical protein
MVLGSSAVFELRSGRLSQPSPQMLGVSRRMKDGKYDDFVANNLEIDDLGETFEPRPDELVREPFRKVADSAR